MNLTHEQQVLLYILSLNPGHSMTVVELVDILNEDRVDVIRQYRGLGKQGLVDEVPSDCGIVGKFMLTDLGERVLSSTFMNEDKISRGVY